MNAGSILFVAAAVGYIGFEIYAVTRNSYRTEPEYIFTTFATAARAVEACGALEPGHSERFAANYAYVQQRAANALKDGQGEPAEGAVTSVDELGRSAAREVDELLREKGCEDMEVWKLRKRYENLARLNLPSADSVS